jgi:hypothetical protein
MARIWFVRMLEPVMKHTHEIYVIFSTKLPSQKTKKLGMEGKDEIDVRKT